MKDTTLATFRVDKDTWESFKAWASERGSNASTELNQFILRALGRIDGNLDSDIDNLDNCIDEDIDKRIDNYLDSNLDNRIEDAVKKYLDKHLYDCIDKTLIDHLDTRIDSSIDTDASNLDSRIDKRIDDTVESNLDNNLDKRIDNNPSEDSLEGVSKENQVLEVIEDETPLETAISEDNPDAPQGDNSESASTTGVEDDGGDEAHRKADLSEIADNADQGLTGKELAKKLGITPSKLNQWRKRRYDEKNLDPISGSESQWTRFLKWDRDDDKLWFPKSK